MKIKRRVDVEIRENVRSTPNYSLWDGIVTTARGRCYRATWAGDKPTEEQVQKAWNEDRGRKDFLPHC